MDMKKIALAIIVIAALMSVVLAAKDAPKSAAAPAPSKEKDTASAPKPSSADSITLTVVGSLAVVEQQYLHQEEKIALVFDDLVIVNKELLLEKDQDGYCRQFYSQPTTMVAKGFFTLAKETPKTTAAAAPKESAPTAKDTAAHAPAPSSAFTPFPDVGYLAAASLLSFFAYYMQY
ncbi:classical arabinogalactan protein 6-like [Pyrus ussuriensis x Pyrus communis]|uniref:Classical arabinogalactan protein 6-like n=1 Tax=Pyrus ussuriensis x Pyrus communis TaxID=2448454 RepID=A0A5N5HWZ3_9ROSA|nr:classical arabinogalactan protein 6-like [Pyrus ussuriensis x Pyrus communis]